MTPTNTGKISLQAKVLVYMSPKQRRIAVYFILAAMTIPVIISVIGAIRGSLVPFY